jgi:hypothetical protein
MFIKSSARVALCTSREMRRDKPRSHNQQASSRGQPEAAQIIVEREMKRQANGTLLKYCADYFKQDSAM